MTKKDYIVIASLLHELRCQAKSQTLARVGLIDKLIIRFADKLQTQNPRFNRIRFYDACTNGIIRGRS